MALPPVPVVFAGERLDKQRDGSFRYTGHLGRRSRQWSPAAPARAANIDAVQTDKGSIGWCRRLQFRCLCFETACRPRPSIEVRKLCHKAPVALIFGLLGRAVRMRTFLFRKANAGRIDRLSGMTQHCLARQHRAPCPPNRGISANQTQRFLVCLCVGHSKLNHIATGSFTLPPRHRATRVWRLEKMAYFARGGHGNIEIFEKHVFWLSGWLRDQTVECWNSYRNVEIFFTDRSNSDVVFLTDRAHGVFKLSAQRIVEPE